MDAVTDSSAVLAVALDEPERAAIIEATEGYDLIAPAALPFEIGNALIAMSRRGRLSDAVVPSVWEATQRIPVQLVPVEIENALVLATTHGIYAYDAYYLDCSLANRRPLITLDLRMREIATTLGIRLLV